MIRRLTVDIRLDDASKWEEGKHPRGQPKNKGEFAKQGHTHWSIKAANAAKANAPAPASATPAANTSTTKAPTVTAAQKSPVAATTKPVTPAIATLQHVQTEVQKQLPVLKYGSVTASPNRGEAWLLLSNSLGGTKRTPQTLPGGTGLIGVAVKMNTANKRASFYEITSDPPGHGHAMVKAILNAMPDYKFMVHVDLSGGFWEKMQQRYPDRFVEES